MLKISKIALLTVSSSLFLTAPMLAEGLVTVDYPNGDTANYSDVQIASSNEVLSIKSGEEGKVLEILKKDCYQEGLLNVCKGGTLTLDTYGVKENVLIKQMYVFTNNTKSPQTIKDSKVTLDPDTLMAEILTQKGTYINISGKIDALLPRP